MRQLPAITASRAAARADAEAYLARLAAFPTALDQETAQARHDAGLGVVAPNFLLDTALGQLRDLRGIAPAQARMVTSLTRRTTEKAIAGDWAGRATNRHFICYSGFERFDAQPEPPRAG